MLLIIRISSITVVYVRSAKCEVKYLHRLLEKTATEANDNVARDGC